MIVCVTYYFNNSNTRSGRRLLNFQLITKSINNNNISRASVGFNINSAAEFPSSISM